MRAWVDDLKAWMWVDALSEPFDDAGDIVAEVVQAPYLDHVMQHRGAHLVGACDTAMCLLGRGSR